MQVPEDPDRVFDGFPKGWNNLKIRTLTLIVGLLCLSAVINAQTVSHLINFDTDAKGNAIAEGATISEQYAAWGVHFVPNVVSGPSDPYGDFFGTNTDMTATASDFDPFFTSTADPSDLPTGNLLHGFTGYNNENGDPNFWISFDKPAINVNLDLYGSNVDDVYGLDANLNFISFGKVTFSPSFASAHVTLDNDNSFRYLVIAGSTDSFNYDEWTGVDNIRFTSVPEPGFTTLLVGLSIVGGILALRRRI